MALDGLARDIERLQQLNSVLRKVGSDGRIATDGGVRQFNLRRWDDGFNACAVGIAANTSWFRQQGLTIVRATHSGVGIVTVPSYNDELHWSAVASFFGLSNLRAFTMFTQRGDGTGGYSPQLVMSRVEQAILAKKLQLAVVSVPALIVYGVRSLVRWLSPRPVSVSEARHAI